MAITGTFSTELFTNTNTFTFCEMSEKSFWKVKYTTLCHKIAVICMFLRGSRQLFLFCILFILGSPDYYLFFSSSVPSGSGAFQMGGGGNLLSYFCGFLRIICFLSCLVGFSASNYYCLLFDVKIMSKVTRYKMECLEVNTTRLTGQLAGPCRTDET